jgi:hypothetical protein
MEVICYVKRRQGLLIVVDRGAAWMPAKNTLA